MEAREGDLGKCPFRLFSKRGQLHCGKSGVHRFCGYFELGNKSSGPFYV